VSLRLPQLRQACTWILAKGLDEGRERPLDSLEPTFTRVHSQSFSSSFASSDSWSEEMNPVMRSRAAHSPALSL